MDNWSKLLESLVFNPSIGVNHRFLEEFKAVIKLLDFVILQIFYQFRHVFDADLSYSPKFVVAGLKESFKNAFQENIVV